MHGGVALWQEEKKVVCTSKGLFCRLGIALWYLEHKKGIAYGGELYKVGEKIVV